jgi:hypothetical protein
MCDGHPFRSGGNTLSERVPVADGWTKGNENVIEYKGTRSRYGNEGGHGYVMICHGMVMGHLWRERAPRESPRYELSMRGCWNE